MATRTTAATDYKETIADLETALVASLARCRAAIRRGAGEATAQALLRECQRFRTLAMEIARVTPPAGQEAAHARFVEGMGLISDAAERIQGAYAAGDRVRLVAACDALPDAIGDGCLVLQAGVELAQAAW